MAVSLEKFTQQVIASGLLSAVEINAFVASAGGQRGLSGTAETLAIKDMQQNGGVGAAKLVETPPLDGEQLARLLVKAKKLTAYQAKQGLAAGSDGESGSYARGRSKCAGVAQYLLKGGHY